MGTQLFAAHEVWFCTVRRGPTFSVQNGRVLRVSRSGNGWTDGCWLLERRAKFGEFRFISVNSGALPQAPSTQLRYSMQFFYPQMARMIADMREGQCSIFVYVCPVLLL